jgi:hypothetical protein
MPKPEQKKIMPKPKRRAMPKTEQKDYAKTKKKGYAKTRAKKMTTPKLGPNVMKIFRPS